MEHHYFEYRSTDEEKRHLRIALDQVRRAVDTHKRKRKEAEDEVSKLRQEKQKQSTIIEQLQKEIEEIKRQRDVYKNMLFKRNRRVDTPPESELLAPTGIRKEKGGQIGHTGHGRITPQQIDSFKRIYANTCPDCHTKLERSSAVKTHTVEDIPPVGRLKPMVTQYTIERQWCGKCQKEILIQPHEVIPGSRVGINLVTYLMLLKYGARAPLNVIVTLLLQTYNFHLSPGGISSILQKTKQWLGPEYERLKASIRASPIIHADETGWRVDGVNKWIWAFLSRDAVCYQVEESRGKGVPQEFFKESNPHTVLVRDDYAAYQSIPCDQQSCWSHLLRKSHEAMVQPNVSTEMKTLHEELKAIYITLDTEVKRSQSLKSKQTEYARLLCRIDRIIQTSYTADDAVRIQTRVRNQRTNLLTALLHTNVPLTNNYAERLIRPLVVTRKISGGSRSAQGAQAHMVNMSIMQSIKLKEQPLMPTLRDHILNGITGKN